VSFPDAVQALDAAAPCDRLAAAQQLIGEAEQGPTARAAAVREALRRRLTDADPRVRFWAAAAAAVWGEPADRLLLSPLADRLRDPDLRVRYRAARTLGMIGDESAVEPLRRMTLGDDAYVADYARAALRQLAVRGFAR
jgi:HEAT repeat protein